MVGVQDNVPYSDDAFAPSLHSQPDDKDWTEAVEADLAGGTGGASAMPLQQVFEQATAQPTPDAHKPLRMALSAIRNDLDRRTREWRGSAKVVEQSLRQLVAAEQARSLALQELAAVEDDVTLTARTLTDALAAFDETGERKNIEPLFSRGAAALEDLERIANELAIAQHWCRSAWAAYAEALEQEQLRRRHLQSADWAA